MWELTEYIKIETNITWVLDIIDYFSKFILSYPLKQKNAGNVLIGIKGFVFSIGVPHILQTVEFVNSKMKEFCKDNNTVNPASIPPTE